MSHRSSLVLAAIVSVTVGVLLMPRDSDANGGSGQPPPANTCGMPKDATPAGTHCDDQNKCTTDDVCDGNGKCAGKPVVCPSLPCATAVCSPASGACVSTNRPDGTRCGPGACKGGSCELPPVPGR